MDDDLQHPPDQIPILLDALEADPTLDGVFGAFEVKHHSLSQNLGSRFLAWVNSRAFGLPKDLRSSSFRALRREVADAAVEHRTGNPALTAIIYSSTSTAAKVDYPLKVQIGGEEPISQFLHWSARVNVRLDLLHRIMSDIFSKDTNYVGFDADLHTVEAADATRDGGFLELHCFQKTDNFEKLAEYRDRLIEDRLFFSDFARIRPPEFTTAYWPPAVEEDRITLSFKLVLYISPQYVYMD